MKSDWHPQAKYESEKPCVHIDFQFISGVAVWCPTVHAKATLLTMVDMDFGYVGVFMVSGKSPDNFMVRSTSSFVDKLRAEKNETEIRRPSWSQSIVQIIKVLEERKELIRAF